MSAHHVGENVDKSLIWQDWIEGAIDPYQEPQEPIITRKVRGRTLFFLVDNSTGHWVLTQSLGCSLRREALPKGPLGPVPTLGTPLDKETLDTVLNSFFLVVLEESCWKNLSLTHSIRKKSHSEPNESAPSHPVDLLFSEEKKMAGNSSKEWESLTLS